MVDIILFSVTLPSSCSITAFSELNVASVDVKLCITVAKNVGKTVKMFCVKSEQLVSLLRKLLKLT